MNNLYFKKIIPVISCAVLSALLIVILFFCTPVIEPVPEAEGELTYRLSRLSDDGKWVTEDVTAKIGKDVTAMRISDLTDLGKITKVNYVANEFVNTNLLSKDIEIVDLTKPFEFAERGTLIFIILNLNPYDEDFYEQSEKLNEYKIGDNWHFTLSLSEIFCASNVYSKTTLIKRNGDIENYDFTNYNTNYDKQTENFTAQTSATYIDLSFYTRRTALENAFNSAAVVTVHYQSTGSAYSGIADCPLIGTEDAVKGIEESSYSLLLAFAILAAVVLAVLAVLSVVEKSGKFLSAIVWIFGITAMLLSRYFLSNVTGAPLLWAAVSLATSFVILGGAQLALCKNIGKAPTKYIFPALSATGGLFAFICPFIPFTAASAMRIVCAVIKGLGAVALTAFTVWALVDKDDRHGILQTACAAIIAVAILASLFLPQIFPAQYNPIFWLCVATTVATFFSVVVEIMNMKRSNMYLTENLHREVERQVKDIKAIIAERDNLLQFVSHDMKKPLLSSVSLLETAIEREKDSEQIKALQIIKQNDLRVVNNLSEIGAYARFNYIAEPSQVTDICELCASICEFHAFDCNANGIILKNNAEKHYKVFVKRQGLENAVSNIIMNAVEHANCKTVTLSVKKERNTVILCIADDGKGISSETDIFKPYVTEKPETGGLGLFICKSIIESMNGKLTYESKQGNTVFYISMLKA